VIEEFENDPDLAWGPKGPKAILMQIGDGEPFKVLMGCVDFQTGELIYESERDTLLGRKIRDKLDSPPTIRTNMRQTEEVVKRKNPASSD